MRDLPLALLPIALLAGCAGNLADHIGPKTQIMAPELISYGLDPGQSECVGQKLGTTLSVVQLRRLARAAAALKRGSANASRLTVADLSWASKSLDDAQVPLAVDEAARGCGIGAAGSAPLAEAAGNSGAVPSVIPPVPSNPVVAVPPATPSATATWLNLGAAATGQMIAVDASSIDKQTAYNQAWFRLTNPGASGPSNASYLLRIDCTAKTINTMASRKHEPTGAVIERIDHGPAGAGTLPIETGTVMEIAYLAICT